MRSTHRWKEAINEAPKRREGRDRLRSVPSVGVLVSAALANTLDRVPFKNIDSFVAYTGLDPRPCDSGIKRGRRRITKRGSSMLRHLLYCAGMCAIRHKSFKSIYEHHREKGLSATAAMVVIARKIARICFSLWKTKTIFDENKAVYC